MKRFVISHLVLLLILFCSTCFSQFNSEPKIDLNDPASFYGAWQGRVSFNLNGKVFPVELIVGNLTKGVIAVSIIDKTSKRQNSIESFFEAGQLKLPFSPRLLDESSDTCKGDFIMTLLEGGHMTGTFNNYEKDCTSANFDGLKQKEALKTILQSEKPEFTEEKSTELKIDESASGKKQAQVVTRLTEGASVLFRNTKSTLSNSDKNDIFKKTGFVLANNKKDFLGDKSEESIKDAHFSARLDITDLNKDGMEEVFIHWGNYYTSGNVAIDVLLFIKRNDEYQMNLGFGGFAFITDNYNLSYPDLLIGGPGLYSPIWRWNGNKYVFYRKLDQKSSDYKKLKLKTLEGKKHLL